VGGILDTGFIKDKDKHAWFHSYVLSILVSKVCFEIAMVAMLAKEELNLVGDIVDLNNKNLIFV